MKRINRKNHFIWLTLSLVGLLITSAFSRDISNNLTLVLIEYSSIALLFLSFRSLNSDKKWGKAILILIVAIVAMVVMRGATESQYFEYIYLSLLLIFMLAAAWIVGGEVLLTGTVDLNVIVGSVALYLLIGIIWSIFYTILIEFSPTAFSGIESGMWYDNMSTTNYFSFVTLTTLGYGDITPATPIAEVLVILEAVTGMFYLAAIVASLVGSMMRNTD